MWTGLCKVAQPASELCSCACAERMLLGGWLKVRHHLHIMHHELAQPRRPCSLVRSGPLSCMGVVPCRRACNTHHSGVALRDVSAQFGGNEHHHIHGYGVTFKHKVVCTACVADHTGMRCLLHHVFP
eukprot:2030295-Amphidinium_carterae.1